MLFFINPAGYSFNTTGGNFTENENDEDIENTVLEEYERVNYLNHYLPMIYFAIFFLQCTFLKRRIWGRWEENFETRRKFPENESIISETFSGILTNKY